MAARNFVLIIDNFYDAIIRRIRREDYFQDFFLLYVPASDNNSIAACKR